jgi:5,10-methylenetetrahydrofolate reductase
MKLKRNLFILLISVTMLITVFVFYNKKDSGVNADNTVKKIWDIEQNDIVGIAMENNSGKYVFQRSEGKWKAIEPANLKFATMRIDGILYTLANLEIMDVIDANPSDIEQYGLAKPSTVTVKLKDGKLKTLEIGNVTALKNGYYVRVKNESEVYKVNIGVGEELLRGKEEFRDRRLFDFVEEDFIELKIKRQDKNLFKVEKSGNGWKVEPSVEGEVDIKRLEPIITTFSYLCVNEYVEDDTKDLDKYGLSIPSYTIDLKTTNFEKVLYLGSTVQKVKDEYIYCRIDDSNDVFLIKMNDISFIDSPSRSGFKFAE